MTDANLPPYRGVAVIRGGSVRRHVKAWADAVALDTDAESFGTYPGHSPAIDQALDIFVPVNSRTLGDAICAHAIDNLERFGIDYLIYRQRIYNPDIAERWRAMEDRGGVTQNHFDHVHVSFYATAPGPFGPTPTPAPAPPQGELAMLTFRYIFDGADWVFDGPSALFFQLNDTRQITEVLDPLGVKSLGKVSDVTHQRYSEIAAGAGFKG